MGLFTAFMKKNVTLALCMIFAFSMLFNQSWAQSGDSKPLAVKTHKLDLQTMSQKIEGLGTARSFDSVDIRPLITEKISEILFKEGQKIEQGEVLVRLEQSEEQALLKEAEAELAYHQNELKRINSLVKSSIATQQRFDERKLFIAQAEARLEVARARLSEREIRAPFSGKLGKRMISVGALVDNDVTITTIDDNSKIKVDFTLAEKYLPQVMAIYNNDLPIYAEVPALKDQIIEGKIAVVSPRIDENSRALQIRSYFDNKNEMLRDGMLLYITIDGEKSEYIAIPERAIMQQAGSHFVYLAKENEEGKYIVTRASIKVALRGAGGVVGLLPDENSNIKIGDLVIVNAIQKLRGGMEVNISEAGSSQKQNNL